MEELIRQIIEKEWPLFRDVNGGDRVSCQNDNRTFVIMRSAQYRAWSQEALESYARDLDAAIARGHSIVREKYIRMMRATEPETYEKLTAERPPGSPEKEKLVAEIWAILLEQTERMRKEYPILALGGRPLYAKDEEGWASVETYQTSELLTYSEETLTLLLKHIRALQAQGIDYARVVQENTVRGIGFPDMATAERAMLGGARADDRTNSCGCGGTDEG